MNFRMFHDQFAEMPLISVIEIEKAFPKFDRNALTRWQEAQYIQKIRNSLYRFSGKAISSDAESFFVANKIYKPSYVSLYSALSWYGFIPEGVFTVTSITTSKTNRFDTPVGHFSYQSVKPELFFGYRLEPFGKYVFKMAEPEKAFLDLLYLNPKMNNEDHFYEMRLNFWEINEKFKVEIFKKYLSLFQSTSLEKRANVFIKFIQNYAPYY